MKKITVLLLCFYSVLALSQQKPKIKGDKNVITVTKEITGGFNAVEIDDALEIDIKQGTQNRYTLTTDTNLHDIIKFTVKDSILKVYTTNKITSSKKLEIGLTCIGLEHITIKNDASLKSEGSLESKVIYLNAYNSSKFDLDLRSEEVIITLQRNAGGTLKVRSKNTTIVMNDRTDLNANITAEKTTVSLTKTSQLELAGDSDLVAFNLKDSAELDARKMKVSSADLYTSNSTDVYIHASKNLELYAKGKSNIYVYGNPKIEIRGLTDKSKIIKK
ncbi:GIN domain-containing protein [Wenyingzhuangia sp. IMCC45533]